MRSKVWWIGAVVAMVLSAGTACTTKSSLGDRATGDTSTTTSTTGGSTGGTGTSTSSTSSLLPAQGSTAKVTFLAQGNAICAQMNQRSKPLGTIVDDPNSSPGQIADAFDQTVAITSEAVAGLRALPQPPGDEAQLAGMYADVDALIATAAQIGAAIRAGDAQSLQTLGDQIAAQQATANAEFNDYGLVECGS